MTERKRQKGGRKKGPKTSVRSSKPTSSKGTFPAGSGTHLNVHVTGVAQDISQAPQEYLPQTVSGASSTPEEIHSDDLNDGQPQVVYEPIIGHIQEHLESVERDCESWITSKLPFQKTDQNGKLVSAVRLIEPTASELTSDFLHPGLYRSLERIESIQQFAGLMNAPDDWEEQVQKVYEHEGLKRYYNRFLSSYDVQSTIENSFIHVVVGIGVILRIFIRYDTGKILVGGLSVLPNYAILSSTDRFAETVNGVKAFGTEFVTEESFDSCETFYHDSRGVQVFSAMYGYECPVFLMTNRKWKMLMMNPSKDGIMTFPCGPITKDSSPLKRCMATFEISTIVSKIEDPDQYEKDYKDLLGFLVICILSAYQKPAPQTLPQTSDREPLRAVNRKPSSIGRHSSTGSRKREARSPIETRSAAKRSRTTQVKTVGKFPIREYCDMFQEVWTMEYTREMEREDWELRRLAEENEGME